MLLIQQNPGGGGEGALNFFFQVGVCGLDFQSVGLVNWYLPLKEGACQLKISKLAWELKYGQNWGCRGQNFQIFSKGGRSCELSLLLEMGSLWTKGEVWKGGLQRRTSPYRLSSSVPPLPPRLNPIFLKFKKIQAFGCSETGCQVHSHSSRKTTANTVPSKKDLRQIHGLQKWHFLNGQCQSECNSFGSNWQAVNVNSTFRNLTTKRLATNYMVSGFRSAIIQGIGLYPRGGHLYFKVDIIRVKRLSKSTLNTYFSKCENIP